MVTIDRLDDCDCIGFALNLKVVFPFVILPGGFVRRAVYVSN